MPEQQRRRRFYHYVPAPNYRSEDTARHCQSLYDEPGMQSWLADALAGQRQHRLSSPSSKAIARDQDTIRCDIAQALAVAAEWDGFSIAHELKLRGWPADVELVQVCNRWSCALWPKIRARLAAARGTLNPERG